MLRIFKQLLISMVLLGLSAGLLASCAPAATETKLTKSDSGTKVELSNGSTLVVSLEANVTTGYQWDVMEVDTKVLKLEGDPEYIADQPQTTGSGGVSVFHFKAVGTGSTPLTLGYFPPDGSMVPAETFTVQVTVK